jgi:DNA-binding MarR family transcriptional regulator/GNAT superfamily N-acetyltransferase
MVAAALPQRIAAVRRFNRFYTQRIGVLRHGWGGLAFSLTQARVLYELAQRAAPTATEVAAALGLDAGYLSRILRGFVAHKLITTERSRVDGRQVLLRLTAAGRKAVATLDTHSNREVGKLLGALPSTGQDRLVAAMGQIEHLLVEAPGSKGAPVLRTHRPGDMGWIVSRHGMLYWQEYGWDPRLEALCAEIVAAFLRNFDPARERCWIAELDGERVGTVMLVKESADVARLRLLQVEPAARGHGIGARLVAECVAFARAAGYRKVTLWTHSVLTAARLLYQRAGFELVASESHNEFGKELVGETWDLVLNPP